MLQRFALELLQALAPLRKGIATFKAGAELGAANILIFVGAAGAQPNVTWQTPVTISGASDVSTLEPSTVPGRPVMIMGPLIVQTTIR